jgi:hypothetical protein
MRLAANTGVLLAAMLAAMLAAESSAAAQPTITPSQTRLIGCFGEAFTLVEHVWRLSPKHLEALVAESKDAKSAARKAFLDGFVSGAVVADQQGAMAVARNLDGCLGEALTTPQPDQTTAVLAASVRIELDSALEDVADYIAAVHKEDAALRAALRTPASDARGSALDSYLAFGEAISGRIASLRARVDAVVRAATP